MPEDTFEYLDHDDIIQFMQSLGYKSCADGVCFGFAMTGVQTILQKEWDKFNRRLRWMTLILNEARERSGSDKPDEIMIRQVMNDLMHKHPEEANIIADIPAFCESIELHFQPEYYRDWFESKKAPSAQDAAHTLSLLLPGALQRVMRAKDSAYKKIADKVFSSDVFTGVYNLPELEFYFKSLLEILKKKKTNFALVLSSASHSKVVGYHYPTKQWVQLDIRTPQVQMYRKCKSIAYEVKANFSVNNQTSFATQLFGTNKKSIEKILKRWKKDVRWQRIHQLDDTKAVLVDSQGRGLIHVAAQNGDVETISRILEFNIQTSRNLVNFVSYSLKSPLQYAVECNQLEVVKFLLKNGANPNAESSLPPLQRAVKMNVPDIVKLLIDNGANIYANCRHGKTAAGRAVIYGYVEVLKVLLNNIPDVSHLRRLIHDAVEYRQVEVLRVLLERGVDVNAPHHIYQTRPVIEAARLREVSMVKLLLLYGASVTSDDIQIIESFCPELKEAVQRLLSLHNQIDFTHYNASRHLAVRKLCQIAIEKDPDELHKSIEKFKQIEAQNTKLNVYQPKNPDQKNLMNTLKSFIKAAYENLSQGSLQDNQLNYLQEHIGSLHSKRLVCIKQSLFAKRKAAMELRGEDHGCEPAKRIRL